MRLIKATVSALLIYSFLGCASLQSFQTAKVYTDKGTHITAASSEIFSLPQQELNDYDEGNQFLPLVMIRKGLNNSSEFQTMLSPNSVNIAWKKAWKPEGKYVFSASFGTGYTFLASSFDDQMHIIDFPVTFFNSLYLSDNLSLTLTPKIVPRFINNDFSILAGTNLNIALGKKITFIPEGGIYYDFQQNNLFLGGGIGFGF